MIKSFFIPMFVVRPTVLPAESQWTRTIALEMAPSDESVTMPLNGVSPNPVVDEIRESITTTTILMQAGSNVQILLKGVARRQVPSPTAIRRVSFRKQGSVTFHER